ncbi:hypothetical protein F5144DRAFT_598533 [Chaetomium tenue]|uniref:Uncharacterized protein n=1 Tax=Chaetomium tenue TaxID=1854479 RepID=A0ACB7PPT8_9PEZI|nr:hypothetical protein F5144DRAFT_598533 [Chaetomium globosum]
MHPWAVVWLLATGIALVEAMPLFEDLQKTLGHLAQITGVTRQYMSCEATYGNEWTTCGSQTEDLETCARNAGFELPVKILESLASTAARESSISRTKQDI